MFLYAFLYKSLFNASSGIHVAAVGEARSPMQPDDEPLLNPRQAAKLAQVSEPKLRLMLQRKELLGYKVGKQWRIRKSQLIKWIQARKPTSRQRIRSSHVALKPS